MASPDNFRAEVSAWLATNCPQSMRTPTPEGETVWGGRREQFINPDSRVWLERMAERGWTAPTWPTAYGGGGLEPGENRVLQEELRNINARPALQSFGIWMLGPALLEFASEEQKLEYLPKIIRGEIRWCQGYSEPSYGSDLAGLQTLAPPPRLDSPGDIALSAVREAPIRATISSAPQTPATSQARLVAKSPTRIRSCCETKSALASPGVARTGNTAINAGSSVRTKS